MKGGLAAPEGLMAFVAPLLGGAGVIPGAEEAYDCIANRRHTMAYPRRLIRWNRGGMDSRPAWR